MRKLIVLLLLVFIHCNVQAEENLLGKMDWSESLESAKKKHELTLVDQNLDNKDDYYVIKGDTRHIYGIPSAYRVFLFNDKKLVGVLIQTKGEKNWPILKNFAFQVFGGANTPDSAHKDPKIDTEAYYWAGNKVIVSAQYTPENKEKGTIKIFSLEVFREKEK